MTLSDSDIKEYIGNGLLGVDPLDIESQIQPASIDLRLEDKIVRFIEPLPSQEPYFVAVDDQQSVDTYACETQESERFRLMPGEVVLASTVESVSLPDFLVGHVHGRSSVGRIGVSVHITAGLIDPGFDGTITLEMVNHGPRPVDLVAGMRVAQLTLQKLESPSDIEYGKEKGSKYQEQSGPQSSRIYEDNELRDGAES